MRLTTRDANLVVRTDRSPLWPILAVAAGLLLIFALDRATDSTPVQHLYYLPIILAAVTFGMPGATLTALSAVVLYHAANPHLLNFKYEESDVIQIVLFVAVGAIAAKLTRDADRLRRMATTDDLTGLHNLRSFEAHLATMVRAAREARTPLAVLVLDVDHLKALNDEHGHLTGAEAVRTVGHILGCRLPPGAVACRYGGDEFVVAVPRGTPFVVHRLADDLRLAVCHAAPVLAGRWFPAGTLSVSIGASSTTPGAGVARRPDADDVDAGERLFRAADIALYRAKASGRNRVCVA
jgi:diguanylate cyclase (GGDEF)-like protein